MWDAAGASVVKPDLHRPYQKGRVSVPATLRVTAAVRDRLEGEAQTRNLTTAGLVATIIEIVVADNLFVAILDR